MALTDPERYMTQSDLERELSFDRYDLRVDATPWDNLLQSILDRESSRLEDWCETVFETTSVTDTIERKEWHPTDELPLPKLPINSVTSVSTEDEGALTESTDFHIYDTYLKIEPDSTTIGAWPTDLRSVDVTWDYGYDGLPTVLEDALVRLCRNAIERTQTDGLIDESTGDGVSLTYRQPADLLTEVGRQVVRYRPSYQGGAMVS